MQEITASVVLYNTPDHQWQRLLTSLEGSSVRLHLYLVDHSPGPAVPAAFARPWITYLKAENRGYGAGHNIVLKHVLETSDYHFVLNPDVYFGPEELRKMLSHIQTDSRIGQLMPQVIYPDGSPQYLCKLIPNPADLFLRRFAWGGLRSMVERRLNLFELRFTGYNRVMDVPNLSGCFMLFSTAALRQVGLFDEQYFLYAEDVDLTRRVHARFRTVFFPDAMIVHDHARASYSNKRALFTHLNSVFKYFNKWGWFWDEERSRTNREALLDLSHPDSAAPRRTGDVAHRHSL